jgi:hypothetical protein
VLAITAVEPVFVKIIPRELRAGALYISMEYGTVVHSCCCGCGEEVVTPLTPTDWRIEYDGESITLRPSVGSWTLPCRSHYFIRANKVIACGDWDEKRIEVERTRDATAKQAFYERRGAAAQSNARAGVTAQVPPVPPVSPEIEIDKATAGELPALADWFKKLRTLWPR